MILECKKYVQDDECFLAVHVKDDLENDVTVLPLYTNKEINESVKNIRFSLDYLPTLLQNVYNAGLNREPVVVKTTEEKL